MFVMAACKKEPKIQVDLIFFNGHIHAVDSVFSEFEALAINKGLIMSLGESSEIMEKYTAKKTINLEGSHVYPGFIDAHSHLQGLGQMLSKVDLTGSRSLDEVLERVKKYASTSRNDWIVGRGYNETLWEQSSPPDKFKLDVLFPDIPVCLSRVDGHAVLVNQKALDLAGIQVNSKIEGGKIEIRDGRMTGILIDAAAEKVKNLIPKPDQRSIRKAFLLAQDACIGYGLTSVTDAGLEKSELDVLLDLDRKGELKIRVDAMLSPSDENMEWVRKVGPYKSKFLRVHSVKLYADGSLGSRGALLYQPYCDDSSHLGLQQHPWDYYRKLCKELYKIGWQVNTHCIGDSSNGAMLKIYAEVLGGPNDRRWRIEHAQVVDPEDRSYFGRYDILPSVQPTHATSDMYMAEHRLCSHRLKGAYAYRSLEKENGYLPLGTDFPVESPDPLGTLISAVFRTNSEREPSGGFLPEEALSFESAIRGMTVWAAKSMFWEKELGSLEKGKSADLVIFNQDLSEIKRPVEGELLQVWTAGVRRK